jgi:hypothetical protein
VITFLKMCFAFILRYEIKEMIQKIRVLKGNTAATPATPLHELEAYLPRPSVQQESSFLINSPPSGLPSSFLPTTADARRRMTRTSGPFDNNPLLSPPNTSSHRRHSSVTAVTAAFQASLSSAVREREQSARDYRSSEDKTTLTSNPSSSTATTVVDVNKSSGGSTIPGTSSSTQHQQQRNILQQQPHPHDVITANKTALKTAATAESTVKKKRSSDGSGRENKSSEGPSMV